MSPKSASADLRPQLGGLMKATVADEAANHDWAYVAVRPTGMPTKARKWTPGTKVTGDCSKGCQFMCWWIPGVPDPMGNDFGLYGNSQTLWLRLQHLDSARELKVGDIVTFGTDGHEHAAMVAEVAAKKNGYDPLLWSFGHPGAPNFYRLSQDSRPQQYLRLPLPEYVPTPLDRARARTGWFAWVAWKLGEGDYARYGAASAEARPDVPKRIPAAWWVRYAKFVARRKRPNAAKPPV